MDTRKMNGVPAGLESLRRRFEHSRGVRKPRSRIPDPLWAAAVKLAGTYGLHRTARTLRVDYYSLKKRVAAASAVDEGRPGRRVGARVRSAPGPEDGAGATFLELTSPAPTSYGECVVEWEDVAGAKMRVQLKGVTMPDLTALSRSFWDSQS
jgi:hypothetical protein